MKKVLLCILLISSILIANAEGIKELMNGTSNAVTTQFGAGTNWARPGAPDFKKLYIYIKDPTNEVVHFGFNNSGGTYTLRDPNGNSVYTNTMNNNCATLSRAIAGPTIVAGASGYTPQTYTPSSGAPAGNYYIEFGAAYNISQWDITVASGSIAYPGRVWSMIWYFDMGGWNAVDAFEATLYAYSTQGFVSKVDYKGSDFRPYVFSLYYNANGPGSSGIPETDRKSVNGADAGTPSFPVFLNPPPEEIMPSSSFGDLAAVPTITRTALSGANKFSFNVASTQPGTFNILLNVENPGTPDVYDAIAGTKDRYLSYNVVPSPGETPPYVRAIPWDGLDGAGNTLADLYNLNFTVNYADGRSHFPTYDAEYLYNGLSVSQVRPTNGYIVKLFWDDSNIPDASGYADNKVELNGGSCPAHRWSNTNYGDMNTINTWWFCSVKAGSAQTLPLPGPGLAPTIQATNITFSEVGSSAMKIGWTNGNGVKRVVFVKQAASGTASPVDGTVYSANPVFTSGTQIGATGWYCVYNDAAASEVVVTGLTQNTQYQVMVCEYNIGLAGTLYNTSSATGNPANQTTITPIQATNVLFSNVTANTATINWTNGNGDNRVVFMKPTTVGEPAPINNTTYTANSAYGLGDTPGSGWYCIYNGNGSSVDVSNLAPNTTYRVMVCEYYGSTSNENYLTATATANPANQLTALESPAHHIVFSNVTTSGMQLNWTNGTGDRRAVFVKQTSSTTDYPIPVDGTTYSANTTFGSGNQIGSTGWYCVYDGTGSTVTISGLAASTDYRVMVCDYDLTPTPAYIAGTVPTNPLSQATYGTTPTIQAHDIAFTGTTNSQMTINWENGNGTKRVVFAKLGNSGTPAPVDGTVYTANNGFGLGSQIGSSGWYCIYNGTGTSVTMNNILEGTTYQFMVCEYNNNASGPLYNTSTAVLNPQNNTSLSAGITVGAISGNTTEAGGTASFTIVLNTQPTSNVTIGLSSDDTSEGTIALSSITFTSANWNNAQTITITGVDDFLDDGDIQYHIVIDAATSGDLKYSGINAADVTVTNVDNDSPPTITSDGGGASAALNIAERTTAVTNVTATDSDVPAQTLTFSITGGADAALFTIDGSTGVLAFVTAPDYENPTDNGTNNVYDVQVTVFDGSLTDV